jgi:hypothetical protein
MAGGGRWAVVGGALVERGIIGGGIRLNGMAPILHCHAVSALSLKLSAIIHLRRTCLCHKLFLLDS